MSKKSKILALTPKVKLEVLVNKILYSKQLKFGINSRVMFLKEMNLQPMTLLFQDLAEIQI